MSAAAALGRAAYVSLASFRRDGREVRTPVWVAAQDGVLYVYTNRTSGKVKRLRRDPRVRLAPCDVRGKLLGDWHEGRARICEDPETMRRGFAVLRRKYGWQLRAVLFASRLGGRFRDRAILAIELDGAEAAAPARPTQPPTA